MNWVKKYNSFDFRYQIHKLILVKSILLSIVTITLLKLNINLNTIANIEIVDLLLTTLFYATVTHTMWRSNSKKIALFLLSELLLFIAGYWIVYLSSTIEDFIYYRIIFREFPLIFLFGHIATKDILNNLNNTNLHSRLAEMRSEIYRLNFRFIPLNIILILVSHSILNTILGVKSSTLAININIYLLFVIPRIIFTENLLNAIKQQQILLQASIIQFFTLLLLGIWWIQKWETTGMILATLAAVIVSKIFSIIKLAKLKIRLNQYFPVSQFLIFSFFLLLAFIIEFVII